MRLISYCKKRASLRPDVTFLQWFYGPVLLLALGNTVCSQAVHRKVRKSRSDNNSPTPSTRSLRESHVERPVRLDYYPDPHGARSLRRVAPCLHCTGAEREPCEQTAYSVSREESRWANTLTNFLRTPNWRSVRRDTTTWPWYIACCRCVCVCVCVCEDGILIIYIYISPTRIALRKPPQTSLFLSIQKVAFLLHPFLPVLNQVWSSGHFMPTAFLACRS